MFLQLQHGGRVSHPATTGLTPVAPSPVPLPETIFTPDRHRPAVVPRELSREGIRSTVADFAAAARRAVDAGFEGVEVHSANGHLLHQFLAAGTNRRTDAYGGSVAGRIRFTAEVTEAVAAAIGADRVGGGSPPRAPSTASRRATPRPSTRRSWRGWRSGSPPYLHLVHADPDGPLFHRLRAAWSGTLIANPVLHDLTTEEVTGTSRRLLAAGADLVALGYFMYVGGAAGYTDYPALAGQPSSSDRVAFDGPRVA